MRKFFFISIFLMGTPLFANPMFHVLDVGYGQCVHMESDGKNYLFDVGSRAQVSKIINHLADRMVTRLDGIFISHAHPDHVGALLPLIEQIKAEAVFWNDHFPPNEEFLTDLEKIETLTDLHVLAPGQSLRLGPKLELHVLKNSLNTTDLNDNSLVFGIKFGKSQATFFGDVGPLRQKNLAALETDWLIKTQLLIWPHHGDTLIGEITRHFKTPPICIVSVGPHPDFDLPLPHSQIEKTAQSFCSGLFRTDKKGDLHFLLTKKFITQLTPATKSGRF